MARYEIFSDADALVGTVDALTASTAIDAFASQRGVDDYSVDSSKDGRVWLCPASGEFFYTYPTQARS